MADRCRSCKAPVRWAVTAATGAAIPLDLEPRDDGNMALAEARVPGGAPIAVVIDEAQRARYAGSLYTAHFATCPDADEHRRPR